MNILRNKFFIIGLIVIVLIGAGVFLFTGNGSKVTVVAVEKKDLVQTVRATGKTKAVDSVDLGFDKSGRVALALVDVGSRVKAGDLLVQLENDDLQADLLKAQASLAEETATAVTNGIAVSDALRNATVAIFDAYAKAEAAVHSNVDQFFEDIDDMNALDFRPSVMETNSRFYFTIPFGDRTNIRGERRNVETELLAWKQEVAAVSGGDSVRTTLEQSEKHMIVIKKLVDHVATVIFGISSDDGNHPTTVATYKSDMASAQASINTALANLVSAREKLNTAEASEVATNLSGSVSAQSARVLQLQAQIKNTQSAIAKTAMYAPFDGVVTKQEVKKGEIATAGEVLVSIISDNKLQIEANISEVNIGKIAVGNPVSITLDAYPGETFSGAVSYIDPGDTIIDGVVNYKVRISLNTADTRIKNGLTANLTIETARRAGALSVPLYAVRTKDNVSYVQKTSSDGVQSSEVQVVLGIVGQDGSAEIVSGLSEGDMVQVGS